MHLPGCVAASLVIVFIHKLSAGGFVMRSQFTRRLLVALVLLLAFGLCLDEASAQRRRSRRSRRITNPVTTVPSAPQTVIPAPSTDPQIISTAEQQANEQDNASEVSGQVPANTRRSTRRREPEPEEDEASVRRTVNELSSQVTKLSEKLTQMEQQQRTLVDLERLSRAEQRAEALRTQLQDVQEKESNLSTRVEQIDFDLKPENIERSVATFGSTRPEDAREARRRALESEKTRVRAQLDLLATSRQRLESAIVTADLEVERLRKRIDDTTEPQPNADTTNNTTETEGTTTTTTTTTPTTTPPSPNIPQF
jgi:myosin heavy subunit